MPPSPHASDDRVRSGPLTGYNSADAAEYLNALDAEEAAAILAGVPEARAVRILEQPELSAAEVILVTLAPERATRILEALADDRAADLLLLLDPTDRERLLAGLAPQSRVSIRSLMQYPPATAGSLMTTDFVSVSSERTVGEVLAHVREVERERETIYPIYVLDPRTRELLQVVTLRRLITGAPDAPILSVAQVNPPVSVSTATDQEEVARLIRRHDLLAIPVLDARRHVMGIVTVDDILDALIAESNEDVQKFGGMEALGKPYLQIPFPVMITKRAGWLSALFIGELLTASAMAHYEHALSQALVLSLFIPLIMSSGGNSGSQATSLLIRSLALREIHLRDWWRVALRELPAGIVLGLILGTLGFTRIVLWQKLGIYDHGPYWLLIAVTIGSALVGIVTFGSLTGSMLPFVLQRLGFDPASASAPFVATLVDVTGLMIYFSMAAWILSGTLL